MTSLSVEPVAALVVAAGSGSRLGPGLVKALRPLAGVPLVTRSVRQLAAGGCTHAVVVIPAGMDAEFADALADVALPVRLVTGGAERQESVARGLAAVASDTRIVLVHDAARALVPASVVAAVVAAVRGGADAVVPVLPPVDSLRRVGDGGSEVVDRAAYRIVQTPQGFDREVLAAAHALVAQRGVSVTDDAAACEYAGHPVTLVPGAREAFKVTEPFDLRVAEALVEEDS